MIAVLNSGSKGYGALAYNLKKVGKGEADILASNLMNDDAPAEMSMQDMLSEFFPYEQANRNTRTKLYSHISLNPHPDDNLTDAELEKYAREYMDGMGYSRQPYVIFKHRDIDRTHLHIVTINVDETGRKLEHADSRR